MDVYLSHNSDLAPLAARLEVALRQRGVGRREPVSSGSVEVLEVVRSVPATVVLVNRPDPGDWIGAEWRAIIESAQANPWQRLVVMLVGDVAVPQLFASARFVRMVDEEIWFDQAVNDLGRALEFDRALEGASAAGGSTAAASVAGHSPSTGSLVTRGAVRRWAGRLRRGPPWLISLAFHAVLWLLLAELVWQEPKPTQDLALEQSVLAVADLDSEEDTTVELDPEDLEEPEELLEPDDWEPEEVVEEEPVEEPADVPSPIIGRAPLSFSSFSDLGPGPSRGRGGGGRGGHYGRRGRGGGGHPQARSAVAAGLRWLAMHQSRTGSWDSDGFMSRCGGKSCGGAGHPAHDVGVTALATLAFLGAGHTPNHGEHRRVVQLAVHSLLEHQTEGGHFDSGSIYSHVLATMAMIEASHFTRSQRLVDAAQRGVDVILAARNPGKGWRYSFTPRGDNDVSVTGWALFALFSARDSGLQVKGRALIEGMRYIESMTDSGSGRTGYSSRGAALNGSGEAMTAVAALLRVFYGDVERPAVMKRAVRILQREPPTWEQGKVNLYSWYYATYALWQMGGDAWKAWEPRLLRALVDSQSNSAHEAGSWNPIGRWCHAGGRVYSTSLAVLCLEVYDRYGKLYGTR